MALPDVYDAMQQVQALMIRAQVRPPFPHPPGVQRFIWLSWVAQLLPCMLSKATRQVQALVVRAQVRHPRAAPDALLMSVVSQWPLQTRTA